MSSAWAIFRTLVAFSWQFCIQTGNLWVATDPAAVPQQLLQSVGTTLNLPSRYTATRLALNAWNSDARFNTGSEVKDELEREVENI
jgi:hypothetical protein